MSNILLVEPGYRSKFPPIGLLKIAAYHKQKRDQVTFTRGKNDELRDVNWHRIYVSSLFTWELPRTVKTIKFYSQSVSSANDIYVGGIGATLFPEYIRNNAECRIIMGQIDKGGMLGKNSPAIAKITPDYSILEDTDYDYKPKDSYFVKITKGCFRKCKFCAVPKLEDELGYLRGLRQQLEDVDKKYGQKQDLVILDNNILGIGNIEEIIKEIAEYGFNVGAKRNGRQRAVDFNQGIDARVISRKPRLAKILSSICIKPVRLAFDKMAIEKTYRRVIQLMHDQGFKKFTNYMLFNHDDTPKNLYDRFMINIELNQEYGIRISGFPMRFIPMNDVKRNYVSKKWKWKYLRGIQCVLLRTRGMVSPNPNFIWEAFGKTYEDFLNILAMPDRYIIYRFHYRNNGADDWLAKYSRLSESQKNEFLGVLEQLNRDRNRKKTIQNMKKYRGLIEHYYPGGETPSNNNPTTTLSK